MLQRCAAEPKRTPVPKRTPLAAEMNKVSVASAWHWQDMAHADSEMGYF